jgi:hypothetical protein
MPLYLYERRGAKIAASALRLRRLRTGVCAVPVGLRCISNIWIIGHIRIWNRPEEQHGASADGAK